MAEPLLSLNEAAKRLGLPPKVLDTLRKRQDVEPASMTEAGAPLFSMAAIKALASRIKEGKVNVPSFSIDLSDSQVLTGEPDPGANESESKQTVVVEGDDPNAGSTVQVETNSPLHDHDGEVLADEADMPRGMRTIQASLADISLYDQEVPIELDNSASSLSGQILADDAAKVGLDEGTSETVVTELGSEESDNEVAAQQGQMTVEDAFDMPASLLDSNQTVIGTPDLSHADPVNIDDWAAGVDEIDTSDLAIPPLPDMPEPHFDPHSAGRFADREMSINLEDNELTGRGELSEMSGAAFGFPPEAPPIKPRASKSPSASQAKGPAMPSPKKPADDEDDIDIHGTLSMDDVPEEIKNINLEQFAEEEHDLNTTLSLEDVPDEIRALGMANYPADESDMSITLDDIGGPQESFAPPEPPPVTKASGKPAKPAKPAAEEMMSADLLDDALEDLPLPSSVSSDIDLGSLSDDVLMGSSADLSETIDIPSPRPKKRSSRDDDEPMLTLEDLTLEDLPSSQDSSSHALGDDDATGDFGPAGSSIGMKHDFDEPLATGSDIQIGPSTSGIRPTGSGISLFDDDEPLRSASAGASLVNLDSAHDEEYVLGGSSGSDITLKPSESGIGIGAGQSGIGLLGDSGIDLARQDPLDLGASSLGVSADSEFLLEPMDEGDADESDQSGSQVIALEADAGIDESARTMLGGEEYAGSGSAPTMLPGDMMYAQQGQSFAGMASAPMGGYGAQAPMSSGPMPLPGMMPEYEVEDPNAVHFSGLDTFLLGTSTVLLIFATIMAFEMIRTMGFGFESPSMAPLTGIFSG